MSGGRRIRKNRDNRRDFRKRKLEEIARQEKEQKLKRNQRRTFTDTSTSAPPTPIINDVEKPSTHVENKGNPDIHETADRRTNPIKNSPIPPYWGASSPKPKCPPAARSRTLYSSSFRKKKEEQNYNEKWDDSSDDNNDLFCGKGDPIRDGRRKRSKILSKTGRNSNVVGRSDSRCRVSHSPPAPATMATLPPPESKNARTATKARNESESDSDSDGSFNMMALWKENKAQRLKADKTRQQENQTTSAGVINDAEIWNMKKGKEADLDDEVVHDGRRKKCNNGKIPRRRKRVAISDVNFVEDGLGSSEDGGVCDDYDGVDRKKNSRNLKSYGNTKVRRREYSGSSNKGHESQNDSSDDLDTERPQAKLRKKKKPRNPLTLEREASDNFFLIARAAKATSPQKGASDFEDIDDGFMSDCEPISEPVHAKAKTKAATTRYRMDNLSRGKNNSTSRKKIEESSQQEDRFYASGDEICDSDENDDYSGAQKSEIMVQSLDDLHPQFKNPKFGPYAPIEPLLLSHDQSKMIVQVPASLNRYLAPYQKEGVKFMYNCLSRRSGVILGDEMGCGKTVQVISLLCAMFNKTGTGKDLEDIRERDSFVRRKKVKLQKQRDLALRRGEVVDENIKDWKATSLSLSPWNPVMIIVPPTIMDTWKIAFATFSHFSVSFFSREKKTDVIDSMLYGNADILVVPKSAFQRELHFDELNKIRWKLVVIDEFHNFKNHKAKISIHLRKLKELHQPLILGMTGTPMQNNHKELWNLVDLVETNFFGTQEEFNINFDRPITLGRQKCANPRVKARSEAASAELRNQLSKIYIKREKNVVLKGELPEKNEQMILCDLSPLQKEVYKACVELPDFDLVKHGSRPCDCGINKMFFRDLFKLKCKAERLEFMRTNKRQVVNQAKCCWKLPVNPKYGEEGEPYINPDAVIWRSMDAHCTDYTAAKEGCKNCPWCCTLPCLTKLNKLSSHLGLLQACKTKEPKGSPAYNRYIKEKEFAKVSLAGITSRLPGGDKPGGGYDRNDGIMDDHFSLSGKLKVLDRLLQKYYAEEGKVLLFSHSTQSLGLIQNWLKSRGLYEYRRMDGSTPLSKRQQLTDEFNKEEHIFLFLLSIKATGLGLNLTSANRVIMFDVSWNPSWEIQAQDRAHRIGQTRDVRVVRLISRGTVEEMIYLRQIYKIHLKQDTLQDHDDIDAVAPRVFRGVQGDKYRKGEIFGTENLFRFKENGSFLDDIWAELSSKGNDGDSSGLDIRDSGELSKLLLDLTDEDKVRIREENNVPAIGEVIRDGSDKLKSKTRRVFTKRTTLGAEEFDSELDDKICAKDEPLEGTVRAVNHGDLFRSDKGGAAIASGEDGFEEEMGGQTQAAYEIYENVIGDFIHEDHVAGAENGSCEDKHNENDGSQTEKNEDGRNQSNISPTIYLKPSTSEKSVDSLLVPLKSSPTARNPRISKSRHSVKCDCRAALASIDVAKSDGPIVQYDDRRMPTNQQQFNNEGRLIIDASFIPQKIHNKEKHHDPQKICAKKLPSIQTKNKVLLMGYPDIDNVKTTFSITDLRRPYYGRKKTKKKTTLIQNLAI